MRTALHSLAVAGMTAVILAGGGAWIVAVILNVPITALFF